MVGAFVLYLCITPERQAKTKRIMDAMALGWPEPTKMFMGMPPWDEHPFMLWGQRFLAERVLPAAVEHHRPFWHIDNGYWEPARGSAVGFYRATYRSLGPVLLPNPWPRLAQGIADRLQPWRKDGRHILVAMPGEYYGCAIGLSMRRWSREIVRQLKQLTDRPIKVRNKPSPNRRTSVRPLAADLKDAWALVTHSSNVAVDAVLAGIPVFVQPGSPAEPVGRVDLDIEHPATPDRVHWLQSLACQQFTLDEMRDGTAYRCLMMVKEQKDDLELRPFTRHDKGHGAFQDWRHGHDFAIAQQ